MPASGDTGWWAPTGHLRPLYKFFTNRIGHAYSSNFGLIISVKELQEWQWITISSENFVVNNEELQ